MNHRLVHAIEDAFGWADASYLGASFIHASTGDVELCRRLLSATKLFDLIAHRSLEPPQLRCFRDGVELHPSQYLTVTSNRRRQPIKVADARRLSSLARSGFTVVLDALNEFDATLEVACRALQWWSHEIVQVNAYFTTQATAGFPLHWDDHDVIVMQLEGEKAWEVRDASRRYPMFRDADNNSTPSERIVWAGTMRQGDIMHIPRGYWHQATRLGHGSGVSLHVTFGIVKRTGVDWLSWVADRSRESVAFREDLRRPGDASREADQRRTLQAEALRLIEELPPEAFLRDREDSQPAGRSISIRPLRQDGAVVCVTEFPPRIEENIDTVTVVGAGKSLTFKKVATEPLRALLSGEPIHVSELAEITGTDAYRIADALVEEGFCAELTPELCSGYTDLVMSESSYATRLTSA